MAGVSRRSLNRYFLRDSLARGGRDLARPDAGHGDGRHDCAEVSPAAWPSLRYGVYASVLVDGDEIPPALSALAGAGLVMGECAASTVAALQDFEAGPDAVLIGTEGPTGAD